ncbi:MAG: 50S ribosomal protein L9 [Clostridia bacterium]|nr:50S ribosomal protein L9 [Clostridia bacterium]
MKVVLLENVKKVGKKLDIVEVSEGYAKNYLLPRKLAKEANNQAISEATGQKSAIAFKKQTAKEEALMIKAKVESFNLIFKLKAQNGKFFGSVTSKEIAEEINKLSKLQIDKKKIELDENVKRPGVYNAKIKLYEGVLANVKINVQEE